MIYELFLMDGFTIITMNSLLGLYFLNPFFFIGIIA
jgi:hypothetical protein